MITVASTTAATWMMVIFYFTPGGDLARTVTLVDAAPNKAKCEWARKQIPTKDRDGLGMSIRTMCLRSDQYPEFSKMSPEDQTKELD